MDEHLSRQARRPSKIIFIHIHKTAGMSLRGLFVKNYRESRHFNTGLMEIDQAGWDACVHSIKRLDAEAIKGFRVFKGHMPFGLHEILPAPCRYITFLRNPVQRVLSHYRMAVRKRQLPTYHQLDPNRFDWNLGAAPELGRSFDNWQTRILAGASPGLPFGACTDEHLHLAKRNIDTHFEFVGLTEHFDLSLTLMRHLCGWKWHFYVPDNVAPPDSICVLPDVIEKIRHLNRFDCELYRHAQDRFQVLVDHHGWRLRGEHRLFALGNAAHQLVHRWRHTRRARALKPSRPAMRALPASEFIDKL